MWKFHFLFILTICVFAKGVTGDDEDDRKLDLQCEDLEDCEDVSNSKCGEDEICECLEGYLASSDKSKCLPLAKIVGDKCETVKQCSAIPSAECLNNTCVLPKVNIPTTNAQPAKVQPTIGPPEDECGDDSDCPTFLTKRVCRNGTCVLEIPAISPRTVGLDLDIFHKSCANDSECPAEGMACIEGHCKCSENFVANGFKTCLPKAKALGDKCKENIQCLSLNNSICNNEKCTKVTLELFNNLGAKPSASPMRIGSTCQTDAECENVSHAKCRENVCQCEDKYVTSVSSNACLAKAKKEGDPCEEDKQCEDIKGATCLLKKCVKPGIVGTKLGNQNSGQNTATVSKLILSAIFLIKVFSV